MIYPIITDDPDHYTSAVDDLDHGMSAVDNLNDISAVDDLGHDISAVYDLDHDLDRDLPEVCRGCYCIGKNADNTHLVFYASFWAAVQCTRPIKQLTRTSMVRMSSILSSGGGGGARLSERQLGKLSISLCAFCICTNSLCYDNINPCCAVPERSGKFPLLSTVSL